MMLWTTLLAMATLEVAAMVRTLVVIATTLANDDNNFASGG
jgi:hypothetical protein